MAFSGEQQCLHEAQVLCSFSGDIIQISIIEMPNTCSSVCQHRLFLLMECQTHLFGISKHSYSWLLFKTNFSIPKEQLFIGIDTVTAQREQGRQRYVDEQILKEYKIPGGVPGYVLRTQADQLEEVFTDISNLSLLHSEFSTCFKKATINSGAKENKVVCINDYHWL